MTPPGFVPVQQLSYRWTGQNGPTKSADQLSNSGAAGSSAAATSSHVPAGGSSHANSNGSAKASNGSARTVANGNVITQVFYQFIVLHLEIKLFQLRLLNMKLEIIGIK